MYDRIAVELKGVQQALYSSRVMSTAPPSSEGEYLGDDPAQLHRLAYSIESRLHHAQESKEHATEALKQEKQEDIKQCWVVQEEKYDLQTKFAEDRVQIQKEKE
jgi:hypothetical protein